MLNTLLGTKQEMSQTFVEGTRVPVSLIKVGPCTVTQIKKESLDGYWAVQLGFGEKKIKNITKPLRGHLKGAIRNLKSSDNKDKMAPRFLREIRVEEEPGQKKGDVINVSDVFKKGDIVAVTGVSKGKGFQGVVKRWRFAGGPRTHGQSDRLRAPGSIGQGTTPGRVWKGKKMPGRMGGKKVYIKNLVVVSVDPDDNELVLSGPVPGSKNSLLVIKKLASGKVEELARETPKAEVVEGKSEEGEESEGKEIKDNDSKKQDKRGKDK